MAETIPKSRLDEMVARAREEAAYLDGRVGFTGPLSVICTLRDNADAIEALSAKVAWLQDADRVHLSAKLGMEKRLTERAEAAESSLASVTAERDALEAIRKANWDANQKLGARIEELKAALVEISSPTQTLNLLWWQERARAALTESGRSALTSGGGDGQ